MRYARKLFKSVVDLLRHRIRCRDLENDFTADHVGPGSVVSADLDRCTGSRLQKPCEVFRVDHAVAVDVDRRRLNDRGRVAGHVLHEPDEVFRVGNAVAGDVTGEVGDVLERHDNVVAGVLVSSVEPGDVEAPGLAETGEFAEISLNHFFAVDVAVKSDDRLIVEAGYRCVCRDDLIRQFVGAGAQSAVFDRARVLRPEILTDSKIHVLHVSIARIGIGEGHDYVVDPCGLSAAEPAVRVLDPLDLRRFECRRISEDIGENVADLIQSSARAERQIELAVGDADDIFILIVYRVFHGSIRPYGRGETHQSRRRDKERKNQRQ